jgi:hypothetical protein
MLDVQPPLRRRHEAFALAVAAHKRVSVVFYVLNMVFDARMRHRVWVVNSLYTVPAELFAALWRCSCSFIAWWWPMVALIHDQRGLPGYVDASRAFLVGCVYHKVLIRHHAWLFAAPLLYLCQFSALVFPSASHLFLFYAT